jgi:hypothetical protein
LQSTRGTAGSDIWFMCLIELVNVLQELGSLISSLVYLLSVDPDD